MDFNRADAKETWQRGSFRTGLTDEAASFAWQLVEGVLEHRRELDEEIHQLAPEFPIEQMARIDRNVLRIALYELRVLGAAPAAAIIDEAVGLAQMFGSEASPKFVNGVLATAGGGRKVCGALRSDRRRRVDRDGVADGASDAADVHDDSIRVRQQRHAPGPLVVERELVDGASRFGNGPDRPEGRAIDDLEARFLLGTLHLDKDLVLALRRVLAVIDAPTAHAEVLPIAGVDLHDEARDTECDRVHRIGVGQHCGTWAWAVRRAWPRLLFGDHLVLRRPVARNVIAGERLVPDELIEGRR